MNNETASRLKSLQSYKAKLKGQLPVAKKDMQEAQSVYNETLTRIKNIDKEIEALSKDTSLVVSEHALLRYMERVMGVDLDEIRAKMIGQVEGMQKSLGNGKYPIDGGRVLVKDNVIITVET